MGRVLKRKVVSPLFKIALSFERGGNYFLLSLTNGEEEEKEGHAAAWKLQDVSA